MKPKVPSRFVPAKKKLPSIHNKNGLLRPSAPSVAENKKSEHETDDDGEAYDNSEDE